MRARRRREGRRLDWPYSGPCGPFTARRALTACIGAVAGHWPCPGPCRALTARDASTVIILAGPVDDPAGGLKDFVLKNPTRAWPWTHQGGIAPWTPHSWYLAVYESLWDSTDKEGLTRVRLTRKGIGRGRYPEGSLRPGGAVGT